MNYFELGTIPYSWNPKNTVLKWSGWDNPDTLQKHPKKEFWSNVDISYVYNPQGFRTYDLEQYRGQTVDVALGCSFTEGIAMPASDIWTTLIEQHTKIPMLNLGLGGGSTDTVTRILTNIAPLFKINNAYILWPKMERFEQYFNDRIQPILPMACDNEHIWNFDPSQSTNRFHHNQNVVRLLSDKFKFNVIERDIAEFYYNQVDTGRDNTHFGYETNKNVAESFLTE